MAFGTSPKIPITGEDFRTLSGVETSPIEGDGLEALPPLPSGANHDLPSEAMYRYQNQYRDFAFQKITPPDYGWANNLARITGLPANVPDFVADFHFIGMMRSIDDMIHKSTQYKGVITGSWETPKPKSAIRPMQ